jgi:glucosylceramidase
MITIDSNTKLVKYNPEFYLMKHFSAYIKPGAYKIETSDENCIAFKNPGSVVIVYYNSGGEKKKDFVIDNIRFSAVLSEKSFNTFKITM